MAVWGCPNILPALPYYVQHTINIKPFHKSMSKYNNILPVLLNLCYGSTQIHEIVRQTINP